MKSGTSSYGMASKCLSFFGCLPKPNGIDRSFSLPFLARMLFSSLVDADFLETEAFYAKAEGGPPPARGGQITADHVQNLRDFLARHRDDSPVNRLRSRILDHANAKAPLSPGLFTLTVPMRLANLFHSLLE
jgi:CRISPR-associated endonuclease/helicase Cas3